MPLNASQQRSLIWIAAAVLFIWALWWLGPVLTPFIVAAVLAYALHPAVEELAARRWPRLVAVIVVEALAIVALLALLLLLVPVIAKELPLLREQIPVLADKVNQAVAPWLAQLGLNVALDSATIKAFVLKHMSTNMEEIAVAVFSSVRIGGSAVLALVGNAFLMPVVLFYLLIDWPQLVERVQALIPPRQRLRVRGFLAECDMVLGQYLRGQLMVMGVLALYYSLALGIAGFDLALPVGVFSGLAIFIPYLGFALGVALALLAGLLEFASWYGVIVVAVVYGIGQVAESLVLTPRLVGERIGLNPLAVIFALLAFGHVFGFVGVLVALPVSAVVLVGLRRLRQAYVTSKLFLG
jgi:predicted PurR-regulated permease PerM